jgi:hypothetical protein
MPSILVVHLLSVLVSRFRAKRLVTSEGRDVCSDDDNIRGMEGEMGNVYRRKGERSMGGKWRAFISGSLCLTRRLPGKLLMHNPVL